MVAGDLTASTPTICQGAAAVKTHIDTLNLAAVTDVVMVVPIPIRTDAWIVFKIQRATA